MSETYLVRLVKSERHGDTRDYVGVFVANSLSHLACLIDEHTDPGCCQYMTMPKGGGVFFQNINDNIPGVSIWESESLHGMRWRNVIPKGVFTSDFMWGRI